MISKEKYIPKCKCAKVIPENCFGQGVRVISRLREVSVITDRRRTDEDIIFITRKFLQIQEFAGNNNHYCALYSRNTKHIQQKNITGFSNCLLSMCGADATDR